jgi:hypothetical protein
MDAIQCVKVAVGAWLMFTISPLLFADAASDATRAINDINAAQTDAAANVPSTATAKTAEDRLDTAARATDDAKAANEATKANPNATQAQKDSAQTAVDNAQAAEDKARENADTARGTSNDPDRVQNYREALERRRDARNRLKKAEVELRRALGNERRYGLNSDRQRAIEDILGRARRALSSSERTVAMVNRGGDEGALVARDAAKEIGRTAARDTATNAAIAGGIKDCNPARPPCGGCP